MTVTSDGKKLTITIEIDPHASKSGKSLVIASTGGNLATECKYEGKPVVVGLNAYVKA